MSTLLLLIYTLFFTSACSSNEATLNHPQYFNIMIHDTKIDNQVTDTITLGGGCFWCTEAQFLLLHGVLSVTSGYAGGHTSNPTYKEICTGATGHAEVIQVAYDKAIISTDEILAAFWQSHDPTQLNRQGNDVGTQYRSVIFYHNDRQKQLAEMYIKQLNEQKVYDKPIVTQIAPLTTFYPAENYHQNYYNENSSQGYCMFVIQPKIEKFKKVFGNKLKQK